MKMGLCFAVLLHMAEIILSFPLAVQQELEAAAFEYRLKYLKPLNAVFFKGWNLCARVFVCARIFRHV